VPSLLIAQIAEAPTTPEEPSRRLDPHGRDEARRRGAHLAREHAREVPRAHRHAPGEGLDRQVVGRVVQDVRLEVAQRLVLRELHRELRTELRLAARPAQEHDQLPAAASATRRPRSSSTTARGPCLR
jgi:hypothetical protein